MQSICYILLDQSLNLPSAGRDGTDEGSKDCLKVNDNTGGKPVKLRV